jgi:hypothetical protein
MGGEGMEATDLAGVTNPAVEDTPRRGCLAPGCGCMDARIVSTRRARFHAYLARSRGETADRVIAPDREWRLPMTPNEEA